MKVSYKVGYLIFIPPKIFIFFLVDFMNNLFENCFTSKHSNLRVKNLQKYSLKCEKISWGCDELKLISQNDYLSKCPCFLKLQGNSTNSKDIQLDCSKFEDCIFDSVSITLDVYETCLLYKVLGVYEGNVYDLIDFRFFSPDSQKAKVNGYMSDILVHGKARRLQVVSGGKFNIYEFLNELVCYDVKHSDKFIIALDEYYITRFDFRIDFFHDNKIGYLKYSDVFGINARKNVDNLVIDRKSKKLYTGWSAGNRKDKYIYTRMYQKQIEVLDKGQGDLYSDYIEYDGKVWRLEFEFLSKFTTARKKITLSDEFVNHELSKQIFEYIGVSEKNGYFSKPKNKIEVPFISLSVYKKKRLITQTMNNIKKIYKGGINPFIIVNQALIDLDSLFRDSQVIHCFYEDALWNFGETYEELIERIDKSKSVVDEKYQTIYKNQLGIEL